MTREGARAILEEVKTIDDSMYQYNPAYLEALEMAIAALKAELCGDAVSREAVLEIMSDFGYKNTHEEMLINARIKALPPVTPKQRTGKWIQHGIGFRCSECTIQTSEHNVKSGLMKYCPNCGAKMEGVSE